jgi:hypothetical protein
MLPAPRAGIEKKVVIRLFRYTSLIKQGAEVKKNIIK